MAGLKVVPPGGPMEPVVSSPSSENIRRAQLLAVSTKDVESAYRRGYITAAERNAIVREKAHATFQEMLNEKGFFGSVLSETVKHLQAGFDNIRDAVVREIPEGKADAFKADMMASAQAMWGQVQIATSVFFALGDIGGEQVERWALAAGASPGLARILNISANVGSGFIPVGKATQSAVRGMQKVQQIGAKAKDAEAAAKAAEAAKKLQIEMDGVNKLATEAVGEGLKAEGVSRRAFLQFLGTSAAVGPSVLKGMAKATPEKAIAETAKIVEGAAAKEANIVKIFKSLDEEVTIFKTDDGKLLISRYDSGARDSYYSIVDPKTGKALDEFSFGDVLHPDDFTSFNPEALGDSIASKYAKTVHSLESGGPMAELPVVQMNREQEIWAMMESGATRKEAVAQLNELRSGMKQNIKELKKELADPEISEARKKMLQDDLGDIEESLSRTSAPKKKPKEEPKEGEAPKEDKPKDEGDQTKGEKKGKKTAEEIFDDGDGPVTPDSPPKPDKGIDRPIEDPGPPVIQGPPSPREKFMQDFKTFKAEMADVTEPQAHAQTERLAERLGLTLDDLRNVHPGQALDEKEMLAYLKALEPQVDELVNLAKKAKNSEADANAFAMHASELFTTMPIFRGAEVTAGRSVDILKANPPMKNLTDMLTGWDPDAIANGNFRQAILSMAEDVVAVADRPMQLTAATVQMQSGWSRFKEGVWPMARELYMNMMLARPVTHVRNFLGGSVASANAIMERTVGGMFSADKANGLVGQEGWYLLKGMGASIGDGIRAFGGAYKGKNVAGSTPFDYGEAIPGLAGRIIRTPGDTTRAMDNFFKTIMRRGSFYAEALRDGTHAGLKGDELADYVARKVNFPTKAMQNSADEFATYNTFQNDLGTLGRKVKDLGQTGPLVLYFPFMKTPINLAKYAWNRTPGLQLFSKQLLDEIATGGVKADEAIGRITMATMQGWFIYQLAQEGFLTGSGPVDPGLRRAWMATHQPYSVKTKDGWMPITNAEPGSTPIGLVADFAQIHNQLDEPSAEQAAMSLVYTIMKGMADKTYWRTMSDLVDMASGVDQGRGIGARAREVFMQPFLTVATGGPLVASATRAIDPIQRETRTFVDSFMAKVPGYSKDVPPVRDSYGDPVLPPQAVGGAWLNFVTPLSEKDAQYKDRVKQEGDRLQIRVPGFPDSIGGTTRDDFDIRAPFPEDMAGVQLTPKERDQWQEIYRGYLRDPKIGIEGALLDNPEYKKATRAAQREMFMDMLATYRSTARDALMIQNTSIGKRMIESQAKKVMPFLGPADQDQMQEDVKRSLDLFDDMAPEMQENLLKWGLAPGGGQ